MAEAVLEAVTDQPDATLILALLQGEPERLDGIAIDPYERAVALALLAERAQNREAAINHWQEAHRLRPDDPVAGVQLGMLLRAKRTPPEGD